MCLLLLQYRTLAAAPVLLAANREELFGRPATLPGIQPGNPRVLCAIDQQAGGTWLGANQYGVVVGVTNRLKSNLPAQPRSRGLLCRELLSCTTAAEAAALALAELKTGRYAGANYLCADRRSAAVVQGSDRVDVLPLEAGVHILTNGDINDRRDSRQRFAREFLAAKFPHTVRGFLDVTARLCRQGPDLHGQPTVILRGPDRGTVSSTILAVTQGTEPARYLHAAGAPDLTPYEDYSQLLQEVLAAGQRSTAAAP